MKTIFLLLGACLLVVSEGSAQTDFIPGYNTIFEDDFSRDGLGDFPAKWNTSGSGEVVEIEDTDSKWLKISMPSAVSPRLKKSLPENFTIEFDAYLMNTTGVAPHLMFGLTSLSSVATGDVYRKRVSVALQRYNQKGNIAYNKNVQTLGQKSFALEGFVDRVLHVSVAVNKSRLRVYLDGEKVIDLPKIMTPEYRKNIFIACSVVLPDPEESIYISNVRIAESDVDARSILIKQLIEEGKVVTSDIQFNDNNELTTESYPFADQLGHAMQSDPAMEVQINMGSGNGILSEEALKEKADKFRDYLIEKFRIRKNRIVTKAQKKIEGVKGKKAVGMVTEIIKL